MKKRKLSMPTKGSGLTGAVSLPGGKSPVEMVGVGRIAVPGTKNPGERVTMPRKGRR